MNLLVSEVKLQVNQEHDYSASYEVAKTETLAHFCCYEMAAGNVMNWRGGVGRQRWHGDRGFSSQNCSWRM